MEALLPLDVGHHSAKRQSRIGPGKGKELALMHKLMPQDNAQRFIPAGSDNGSLAAAVSEGSIASPHLVNFEIQRVVEDQRKAFRATVNYTKPFEPPSVSFRPSSTMMCGVFSRALQETHSEYLTLLKETSYSDIETVAARASEAYHGVYALKGDPTPLRQKVETYIGAVRAYLKVEKLAAECKRPHASEDDLTLQHQKLDDARALFNQAHAERLADATKYSTVENKIANLEAELNNARAARDRLRESLDAKDASLAILQAQVEDEKKCLAELETIPVLSVEEEQLLQEQKAQLESLRNSLLDDLV